MPDAVIEEDLTIDGDLIAMESNVAIKGRITGDVRALAVNVQPGGVVKGTVTAERVTISGELTGTVSCSDLSLNETARVEADLKAKTLSSQKGSHVVGKVEIRG
jgi:cytoskeletal protein CcmA (bactofilin family)